LPKLQQDTGRDEIHVAALSSSGASADVVEAFPFDTTAHELSELVLDGHHT
jgi:hypothetical protein